MPDDRRQTARNRLRPHRSLHDTWEGIGDTIRFLWREAQRETQAKAIVLFLSMLTVIVLLGVTYGAVLWLARSF